MTALQILKTQLGAWQRRGYASLNRLVTIVVMDANKCVDFEVLSKTCKTCEVLEKKDAETYIKTMIVELTMKAPPDQWRLLDSSHVSSVP